MIDTIIQSWGNQWPVIKSTLLQKTDTGVLDQNAFKTIEVEELFDTVNFATTTIGQAVLYRSLVHPQASLANIKARQQALIELQNNPPLRQQIEHLVNQAKEDELSFYKLLYGRFIGSFTTAREDFEITGFGYLQYKRGSRFILNLVANVNSIEPCKSSYLTDIFRKINDFSSSRAYSLFAGPVYISEKGIQSKEERVGSWVPAVKFKPSLFKPVLITAVIVALGVLSVFVPILTPVSTVFMAPLLLIYVPIVGGFDRDSGIIPLREIYKTSPDVALLLDALGQLDELLAFQKYADAYDGTMILADLIAADHHQLNLKDAKNPILGMSNKNYVGNDIVLEKDKLVFITGPNSGGKTAFCKTITQIQILTQIGCYIPAQAAKLSVADKIFYQAPEISHLEDGEGRFGTELKRTKTIFITATSNSLVVLDELSEGTTFEEKLATSVNILDGFHRKGNNTILITHNHQLVDYFIDKHIGIARQVEFSGDAPTYRLIKGISRVSHADRVAQKIGFSKADIEAHLAKKD